MGAAEQLSLGLAPPSRAPLLPLGEVDRIHRARTDAYVSLCSLAWAAMEQHHRRSPPETPEQRDEMERRLVDARARLRAAWDACDAVDEASRDRWAQWVNGGRK